jgi:hypothetical protein
MTAESDVSRSLPPTATWIHEISPLAEGSLEFPPDGCLCFSNSLGGETS